jgi:leucyl-tRNA synthetase
MESARHRRRAPLPQKVWRECVAEDGARHPKLSEDGAADSADLLKLLHETIRKVTDDLDAMRFNTAISQMMIFINAVQKAEKVSVGTMRQFVQLLAPFAPHLGEELWARLGGSSTVMQAAWPQYDPARLVADELHVVVQVNGKRRGEVVLPVGADEARAVAAAQQEGSISAHLAGKTIRRVIYVPGKILNLVVG